MTARIPRLCNVARKKTLLESITIVVILSLAWLANAQPINCQPAISDSTDRSLPARLQDFRAKLDSAMHASQIPGAAVALVSKDSILLIWVSGLADKASKTPVTENTHFCIGSCTKSFTGLAFLKLVGDGKIDLNTPVSEIAPEITIENPGGDTDPVRIIHLLEHTAGFDDSRTSWFYIDGPPKSLRQALEEKAQLRHVRWRPGTRFSYSSPGYTLAGYILEKITGQPYEDYLRQNILIPMGMTTSRIGKTEECRRLLATGYDRSIEPVRLWYDYEEPAGAMNSSVYEMARFIQVMLNRGLADSGQIISDSLFDKIGRPTSTLASQAGLVDGYSFGFGVSYRNHARWYGHSGGVPGFMADFAYNPDRGIGYVVLQNQFCVDLHTDIYDTVRAFVKTMVDSVATEPAIEVATEILTRYSGYYQPQDFRMQIMGSFAVLTGGMPVFCLNDTLYTQGFMEEKLPLIPVAGNLFRRESQPAATTAFIESSDGGTIMTSANSYYERSSAWKIWVLRMLVFGALVIMLTAPVYALFWIPIHLFKKWKKSIRRCAYLRMRMIPLLAVVSLIIGIFPLGSQTMLEFGQATALNILFFLSTLLFAAFSLLSLFTTYRSLSKPVSVTARTYAILLSLSCVGFTLYMAYWKIIGLRLWAF